MGMSTMGMAAISPELNHWGQFHAELHAPKPEYDGLIKMRGLPLILF